MTSFLMVLGVPLCVAFDAVAPILQCIAIWPANSIMRRAQTPQLRDKGAPAAEMCVQNCRTFLWGGAGVPTTDIVGGSCSCICENEGWADHNVLGMPSCVPRKAHETFSAVGLMLSMAGLCHCVYQLRRQTEYHAWNMAASISPIERCRRHLHVIAVTHACISTCFFSMVLGLHGDLLWCSAILLAGVSQFTTNIGGVLTARMLMYTNDQRLMQGTPYVLALSNALEGSAGRYASYAVVCTGATISTILAVATHSQAAIKVAAVAFMCLVITCDIVILRGGMYLVRTIDRSMQIESDNKEGREAGPSAVLGGKSYRGERIACSGLLVARKRMKTAMYFCMQLSAQVFAVLLFAVLSDYGTAAPLIFFGIPMGFAPLIWFSFNVQLHSGRTKRRVSRVLPPIKSARVGPPEKANSSVGNKVASMVTFALSRSQQRHIVPIKIPAVP